MRICIVGAGAIGGYMGARLALAGEHVTLIARGAHLAAIQERGLTLQGEDGTVEVARPELVPAPAADGAGSCPMVSVEAGRRRGSRVGT